jgi:bile acid-coenzyme A ligase
MTSMSIGRRITQLAEQGPGRAQLTCGSVTLSRAELESTTNRAARHLQACGATPGSYVSIALPNSTAFLVAAVGAWKLGAVPQPLSHRLPSIEREAILDLVRPSVLVDEKFEIPIGVDDGPLPDVVAPAWKAPTSGGSTGRPKVVVDGRLGVTDPDIAPAYHITAEGVALIPGPLYHNGPFHAAARALLAGCHVVVMERFDAEQCLRLVEDHRVDFVMVVPTMMRRIWNLPPEVRGRYDLSSLKVVYSIGAPCADWLKRAWIDWLGGDRIWELYAGTERQASTELSGTEWLEHPGTVGRPNYGEIRIVGPDGAVLPPDEIGLIQLRAPEQDRPTYRYLGAVSAATPDGWDTLGDIGSIDALGYLTLADRRTDLILRGGANIYPAEVEAALESHPAVGSSAVIGLPDEDLGERVHAIVHLLEPVAIETLAGHVAGRLVRYKVPATFEVVEEPLRDEAGKLRRSALRAARVPTPAVPGVSGAGG